MTDRKAAELVRDALEEVRSSRADPPRIVGYRFDLGEDQTGDPSIDVLVVLDDASKEEDLSPDRLNEIAEAVRLRLEREDLDRIVYVDFLRERELKNPGLTE